MKKRFRAIAAVLAVVAAMSCTGLTAYADKLKTVDGVKYRYSDSGELIGKYTGWTSSAAGKRYYKDGELLKNKWVRIGGKRFYLDSSGVKVTGFTLIGKSWYFIDSKNGMLTGKQTIDGVLWNFGDSGKWDGVSLYPDGTKEPDLYGKLYAGLSGKDYGGIYYSEGMFVILSLGEQTESAVRDIVPDVSGIVYKECRYSYAELRKLGDKLADALKGKWYGYGVDQMKNAVTFDVDKKYYFEVRKYIEDKGYSDRVRVEIGTQPVLD